jgi:osmotically-inducible protein OsmY
MRTLNVLLCAVALAACASSKSAERETLANNESDRNAAEKSAELAARAERRAHHHHDVAASDVNDVREREDDALADAEERNAARADAHAERARRHVAYEGRGAKSVEERRDEAEERRERAEERAEKRHEAAEDRREAAEDRREAAEEHAADNTGVNERDGDKDTLTALDQSNDEVDREITQKIRKAVIDDDSLSFTAKNVKIITVDRKVTLRGPVKSAAERATIAAAARRVAGARVDNQLEVAE